MENESRICIKLVTDETGTTVDWKFQNMSYQQVREVCQRVALAIRTNVSGIGNNLVAIEYLELEESPQICILFHPLFGAIQASISGASPFDACIMCDEVIWAINTQIMSG